MQILGNVLSAISIICTLVVAFVAYKLSISMKNLKNLILIDLYSQSKQTSWRGKLLLIENIFFKNQKKGLNLDMYMGIEDFVELLSLSEEEKQNILDLAKKYHYENDFGANYGNTLNKSK